MDLNDLKDLLDAATQSKSLASQAYRQALKEWRKNNDVDVSMAYNALAQAVQVERRASDLYTAAIVANA